MKSRRRFTPQVEQLEGRWVPTVDLLFDPAGNLTITGIPDGLITLTMTGTPFEYEIGDGGAGNVGTFIVPGNITMNFTNSPLNDEIEIDLMADFMGGDLNISTGAGEDTVSFVMASGGTIPGNVTFQGVNSAFLDTLSIGGNVRMQTNENLFGDYDLFDTLVGGDLTIFSGNDLDNVSLSGATFIGGSVYANTANDGASITIDDLVFIGRNLTVLGGSDDDTIFLDGVVGGNAYFNLGTAFTLNTLNLDGIVAGNLTYLGGLADDSVLVGLGGLGNPITIGRNIYINAGDGFNEVTFGDSVALDPVTIGGTISYTGGVGIDSVTLDSDVELNRSRVYAQLGLGDDEFTLSTGNLGFLYVDFGFGTDTFNNNLLSPFTFRAYLRNLP